MDILAAILLGILQGITEWLPVSSSAHLALANYFFGLNTPTEFSIAVNLGTLAALLAYTRNDLLRILQGILKFDFKSKTYNLIFLIIFAGIPTAIIGFWGKNFFEGMFGNPSQVSIALIITGIVLFLTRFVKAPKKGFSPQAAFAAGIAQGLAVAPGISRSGSTISAALFFGVKPEDAAKFSFLIGIPAFFVASLIEISQAASMNFDLAPFAIGISVSAIAGYLTIGALMQILKQGRLHYFSYYCIGLGLLSLLLLHLGF